MWGNWNSYQEAEAELEPASDPELKALGSYPLPRCNLLNIKTFLWSKPVNLTKAEEEKVYLLDTYFWKQWISHVHMSCMAKTWHPAVAILPELTIMIVPLTVLNVMRFMLHLRKFGS